VGSPDEMKRHNARRVPIQKMPTFGPFPEISCDRWAVCRPTGWGNSAHLMRRISTRRGFGVWREFCEKYRVEDVIVIPDRHRLVAESRVGGCQLAGSSCGCLWRCK